MMLSDISVKRPVFATVLSLLLVAFGILSFRELPLREYPDIDSPVISIRTDYTGASADIIESKITRPIEDEVSGIEGIRSLQSTSRDGRSSINIEFTIDRDIDVAANDVRDRVSRVLRRLPDDADPPIVSKTEADSSPIIWYNFVSTDGTLDRMELTDYARRYLIDQFTSVQGVSQVRIGGERQKSMRIWLDREKMAARQLTVADVEAALRQENVEMPAGRLESSARELSVRLARGYLSPKDFAALVLKRGDDGYLVRLGEVATVEVGPEEFRNEFRGNGNPMVGIGIIKQSKANTLEMAREVNARAAEVNHNLPAGMQLYLSSDDSIFIEESIKEVYVTFAIAMVLVIVVIFLFLGSIRAMLIPAVTVPISIVASFIALAAFGYSINLVTLLALVLAIGLVVDDSIVVVENIHRRIEEGEPPLVASFRGARQVGLAVFATTLVLIAVFAPVAFLGGNVGRVFTELSVAMGGAVAVSMIVALSLSPVMCAKLLRPAGEGTWLTRRIDRIFERASAAYGATLVRLFRHPALTLGAMFLVFLSVFALLRVVPQEFAPDEDRGKFFVRVTGPEGASYEYTLDQMMQIERIMMDYVNRGDLNRIMVRVPGFGSEAANTGMAIATMADWSERDHSTQDIMHDLFLSFEDVPGVTAFANQRGGLRDVGGGGGRAVQFVVGGDSYIELAEWRDLMLARIQRYPGLNSVDADLKETKPQLVVEIDKTRAADLGVSISAIGNTLETLFNSRVITTYIERGEEYDVIVQGRDRDRRSPQDLNNIYVRSTSSGTLVPLSSLVTFEERGTAAELNRFNRMRAVTISANLSPGYTLGQVLTFLEETAAEVLPERAQIDYKGESREFKESTGALYFVFGLALLIVFLVLAAQFESFIHPLIIMTTVPLALAGALLGLFLTGGTLNVYSQIGIILLIGIAAKNGILIVEFANQLRDSGRTFHDAIVEASQIRLRPILMTSVSTVFGAVPLILASGAGAESRASVGVVVFFGVAFSMLFTLFVVPVFYKLLAQRTTSPGYVAAQLERLLNRAPAE